VTCKWALPYIEMAESADDAGRRSNSGAKPRYASGRCGQPNCIKRFSALRVRFVDDADIPGAPMVSVC
jgi:hypothetical protein